MNACKIEESHMPLLQVISFICNGISSFMIQTFFNQFFNKLSITEYNRRIYILKNISNIRNEVSWILDEMKPLNLDTEII